MSHRELTRGGDPGFTANRVCSPRQQRGHVVGRGHRRDPVCDPAGRSPVGGLFQHVGNRQSNCTGTECFRGDGDRGPCPGDRFGVTALVGALRDQHERYPCGERDAHPVSLRRQLSDERGEQLRIGEDGPESHPRRRVSIVISLGANTRKGGPQKPVPRLV
jgi:hypothetical protein